MPTAAETAQLDSEYAQISKLPLDSSSTRSSILIAFPPRVFKVCLIQSKQIDYSDYIFASNRLHLEDYVMQSYSNLILFVCIVLCIIHRIMLLHMLLYMQQFRSGQSMSHLLAIAT